MLSVHKSVFLLMDVNKELCYKSKNIKSVLKINEDKLFSRADLIKKEGEYV